MQFILFLSAGWSIEDWKTEALAMNLTVPKELTTENRSLRIFAKRTFAPTQEFFSYDTEIVINWRSCETKVLA